jgi:hypothetical protein
MEMEEVGAVNQNLNQNQEKDRKRMIENHLRTFSRWITNHLSFLFIN